MSKSTGKQPDDQSSKHPRKAEDTDRRGEAKNDVGEDNQHKKGEQSADDYIVKK